MKKIIYIIVLLLSYNSFSQDSVEEELISLHSSQKFEEIISKYSSNAEQYSSNEVFYIGMAYYNIGNDSNCLIMMNLAILKNKKNFDAYYIKGSTLNYLNKYDDAIIALQKAIKLYPNYANSYSALGDSFYNLKRYDKSLEEYKKAIEKEIDDDRPYTMIPQIYSTLNDTINSLESNYIAKNKISKETDSYNIILYNIGTQEYVNKNFNKSEKAFKELIEISPNDYQTYSKLIQVYYGKAEYEKSKPFKKKLYNAYRKGRLKDNLKKQFCFDQFEWKDKYIIVYERFEEPKGKLYYKHIFVVYDKNDKVICQIQTENSPISVELNGPKYAIGSNFDGKHTTYTFIKENFKYDNLKRIVVKIIDEQLKSIATSESSKK